MEEFFPFAGPWFWWIVAGALLIAELAMPGFFMLWLAVAAALTAIVDLTLHLSWAGEIFCFAILSFLSVMASWRFVMAGRNVKSESPNLNQKHAGFVGKTYVLNTPIVNGSGKIRVEDALWDVDGPDAEVGTRVKVLSVEGLRLRVERV
jgi:inner membrane protein